MRTVHTVNVRGVEVDIYPCGKGTSPAMAILAACQLFDVTDDDAMPYVCASRTVKVD